MKRIKLQMPAMCRRFLSSFHTMSARSRISVYFLVYTVIMIVIIWLLEVVFLDDFYRIQTRITMESTSSTIISNIENENLSSLTERFADQNGICILVVDENYNIVADAKGMEGCVLHHMARHDLKRYMHAAEDANQASFFSFPMVAFRANQYDRNKFVGTVPPQVEKGVESLISVEKTVTADGTSVYVFLNAVLTPLSATTTTIRNELAFLTMILLITALFLSYLLSRHITRPITEITEASKALKQHEYTPIKHADYQEVIELNKLLSDTAVELKKVQSMQRELIANISHDLRTPLTLVQGYAEMMRDLPSEITPENMQVIVDESKRLTNLVEAVLSLNSLQKGQISSEVTNFSANECITAMIENYNKLLEHEGYRFLYEPSESIVLHTDKMQFQQVLQNLMSNAITYTGEDHTVIIRQTAKQEKARFEIADSGEGIPEEELPYIWERYYRGSKPHKRAKVGSGIGLSIVQSILKASGNAYGVSSQVGEGSTFWFEVDMAQENKEN